MKTLPGGTVTSPKGFLAGATRAGLKTGDMLDLGILYSEVSCVATGLFTTNRIKAAPVRWCKKLPPLCIAFEYLIRHVSVLICHNQYVLESVIWCQQIRKNNCDSYL